MYISGAQTHFGLNEVTHHFVVEVLNGGPLDSLLDILLLKWHYPQIRSRSSVTKLGLQHVLKYEERYSGIGQEPGSDKRPSTCSALSVSSMKIC